MNARLTSYQHGGHVHFRRAGDTNATSKYSPEEMSENWISRNTQLEKLNFEKFATRKTDFEKYATRAIYLALH